MRRLWEMARGATARKGYVALIDQAIVSGTNFAIGILLARFCAVEEYGAYVVAFAIALLLTGLSCALITEPMTVLGSPKEGAAFANYAASLLICQLVLGAVCASSIFGAAFVMSRWSRMSILAPALYGLGAAITFLQGREFFRRLFFARLKPTAVLFADVIYCSAVIGGIFVLKHRGVLGSRNVFLVIAISGFLSCSFALIQARQLLSCASVRKIVLSVKENWTLARWNLAITLSHFGFNRAETFIVAGYIGTVASARMAAARNILAPLHIMTFAMTSIVAPRASIAFAKEGRQRMNRFLGRAAFLLVAICAVYCLGVALMPEVLLRLFYGTRYLGEGNVVRFWALIYFVTALNFAPGMAITSMRRPDIVFGITFTAAAIALGLCFVFVPYLHLTGAMLSHLSAVILMVIASTFAFFRKGIENKALSNCTLENTT